MPVAARIARIAAAGLFAGAALAALPAAAEMFAPRALPSSCQSLAAGKGEVWQAWMRGEHETMWGSVESYYDNGCFRSEAECMAWLYDAQTYYWRLNNFQPCRRMS